MPYSHSVRIAGPGDHERIEMLLTASYYALFKAGYDAETLDAALPIITRANPVLLSSGRFYLTETSAMATGCGGWSIERPGSGEIEAGLGHIRHFAVHPDWLRRGIGGAILNRSIDAARRSGIRRLECNSSLVAVEFYAANGFRDTGPVSADLGNGTFLPGRLMIRDI